MQRAILQLLRCPRCRRGGLRPETDTAEVLCGAAGCGVVGGGPRAYYTLRDMDSHDFKLGMRWMLQPEPVYQPPLVRKG